VNLEPKYPASQSPEDLAATVRAEAYMNRQFLDPVLLGSHPAELREVFGEAWPANADDDLPLMSQPIDFLGINYDLRGVTRHDEQFLPLQSRNVPQPQHAVTETGWEMYAPALTRMLLWVKERYPAIPLYITENGTAVYDPPHNLDGIVDDPLRVWYYREHLKAANTAIKHGVDLRGYFAWSLLDNYEWSLGYSKRFGIVHVNFETQERTLKSSARFYSEVIRTNGGSLTA
jgi:beta-glucosidase